MNAASKALGQTLYGSDTLLQVFLSKRLFLVIVLSFAVFASGLAVVYSKDLNRRLFMGLQNEQMTQDALQTEYGQLLLEQSTWSTQARVQQIAENQLQMQVPDARNVVLISQ